MHECIRMTRVLFSDYELWRIDREGGIPPEFMSSKQLREFFRLYEKEIFKYWLTDVPVRKQFDQWIKEKPTPEAIENIATYALTQWAITIVNNNYLEYSDEEGKKPMSDTYKELLRLSLEQKREEAEKIVKPKRRWIAQKVRVIRPGDE